MRLFNADGQPGKELNHAIEQVRSWRRYFEENQPEKKRVFGAVSRFRYLLVAGSGEDWSTPHARKWRKDFNLHENIEIRSSDIFIRALEVIEVHRGDFWSFEENPITLNHAQLRPFWEGYEYMNVWRML
jgi:hypothetical protein